MKSVKTYRFLGKRLTLRQIALVTGFPLPELYRRVLGRGMSAMAAVTTPMGKLPPVRRAKWPKRITYRGKSLTLREWAEETGLEYAALQHRLRRYGWSVERALSTPTQKQARITFRGRTMTTAAWAKETGINAETIRARLAFMKWPIERALTQPAMDPSGHALCRRNQKNIRRIADTFREEAA